MFEEAVLVIEDEVDGLNLCRRVLERSGFWVFTDASSAQALAIRSNEEISLLLTDIRIPELVGFQFMNLALDLASQVVMALSKLMAAG